MKTFGNIFLLILLCSACTSAQTIAQKQPKFRDAINAQTFYKGNLHTHTTASDGDASPEAVLEWYEKHGYNFVALTDHDKLTLPKRKTISVVNPDFITLNGVEVTGSSAGGAPIHANAICGKSPLAGLKSGKDSSAVVLKSVIETSKEDGAITLLNHPNFRWAINQEELLKAEGFELLEIASGHPQVHDSGDSSHPSQEELWDAYMTKNHRVFGTAVDDAHHYQKVADFLANPGRAWIQVWAPELTQTAICEAIRNGDFYSSKGSKISALLVSPKTMELSVDDWKTSVDYVDFIGSGGQLLERSFSQPARYALRGGEGYVRAHIVQKKREAWTQAYFITYE